MIRGDALLCDPSEKRTLELHNQQDVIRYVTGFHERFEDRTPFTIGVLEELHRLTVQDIYPCAGNIRRHYTDAVDIDASFVPATADEVSRRLPELVERARAWRTELDESAPDSTPSPFAGLLGRDRAPRIKLATQLFYDLLVIHPFRGGNGRVARAFLHLLLYDMELMTPPIQVFDYIERRRRAYFDGLALADRGDIAPLTFYLSRGITDAVLRPAYETMLNTPLIANCLDRDLRRFLNEAERNGLSDASYMKRFDRLGRKLAGLQRRLESKRGMVA
jgi:fido (protein-threonine AMPylation protein)